MSASSPALRAHEHWKLSDWQKMFDEIYGDRNRAAGEASVWFRVLEEIGEVVRECRYHNGGQVRYQLPDILAWLSAFCNVVDFQLAELVWERFKDGCPWCKQTHKCTCSRRPLGRSDEPNKQNRKPAKRPDSLRFDFTMVEATLGNWELELHRLYGEQNDGLDWIDVAARLTEHAGDVAKAIRQRQVTDELKKDLADVFAWTLAVWGAVQAHGTHGSNTKESYADIVFEKYPNWCHRCRQKPCQCPGPAVRIFVSSVMAETSAEREAARGVILEHHLVPIMFEEFHGRFRFDQQAEALRRLFESDVLLLILDESFSMQVHSEFYAAVSQQKQVWVFLRERVSPVKPELQDFVENTLAPHYLYERFRDVDDLKFKIQKRIKKP